MSSNKDHNTPQNTNFSDGVHNVQDLHYMINTPSPSTHGGTFNRGTPNTSASSFNRDTPHTSASQLNRELPMIRGRKRAIDHDAEDTIDLTDNQPERSKLPQDSTQPSYSSTNLDVNSRELYEVFDDDAFEDDAFEDDNFEQTDTIDDDSNMFFPIDDDMMMDLANITASNSVSVIESTRPMSMRQSKSELEMILNALKSKQLKVSDKIIEGLSDNGILQEQKKLLDERKDIVSQIQNIQERIDNCTSQTPDIQTEGSASTINKQRYDNTMEFVERYKASRRRMNWIHCYEQLKQNPDVIQYKNSEVLRNSYAKFKKRN
jgi:hypothetical protein